MRIQSAGRYGTTGAGKQRPALRFLGASLLLALLFFCASGESANPAFPPFKPTDPIMPTSQVKPGMKGEARTVMRGSTIERFPVEVLEIIPQNGTPKNLILIRAKAGDSRDWAGVASGMSGSPVYVGGRLIGAIGYGWNFSNHDMALVTPIEDMMGIWDNPERIPSFSPAPTIPEKPLPVRSADRRLGESSPDLPPDRSPDAAQPPSKSGEAPAGGELSNYLFVQGLSPRMSEEVGRIFGRKVAPFAGGSGGAPKKVKYGERPQPGASVAAALAWGDVEISSMGTLSAVGADGRFVAFAHPLADLGMTSAALMEGNVARIVPMLDSPIKLGTTGDIIGIVTQDRPQGIGGRLGIFAPAANCTINFVDIDARRTYRRSFQMVNDPFQLSRLASAAITGCIENLWGRKGGGSAKVIARYYGNPVVDAWDRTNIFVSEKDVAMEMMKEFSMMTQIFAVNQFQELRPFGIDLTVEMTQDPRVLYIEDVEVPKGTFRPGDAVSLDITLRPWRRAPFKRTYSLIIPHKVSGICELLVRGGGIAEESAEYMEAGWRSISSLPILLAELEAKESNDQLVIELRGQESLEAQIRKARNDSPDDLMNDKLKSEQQMEKLKEGSMRIVRTNYYVDGLIHRLIKVSSGAEQHASNDMEAGDETEAEAKAATTTDETDAMEDEKKTDESTR